MSPAAAAMAALLHAAVALAFLWELPRTQAEAAEQAIEFTVDVPVPAPPENPAQQAAAATPPPAAQPPSPPPVTTGVSVQAPDGVRYQPAAASASP